MFCYNYFIIIIIIIDKKFWLSIWVWVSMNFIVMSMTDVIMKKRKIIVILMRKLCLCAFSTVCPDTEDTNWKLDPMGYIWLLSNRKLAFNLDCQASCRHFDGCKWIWDQPDSANLQMKRPRLLHFEIRKVLELLFLLATMMALLFCWHWT